MFDLPFLAGRCGGERTTGLGAEPAQGAGVGTGRKATCSHAECRGKPFSSALIARLKRSPGLRPRDASARRGASACPGNSEPQPGVSSSGKASATHEQVEGCPQTTGSHQHFLPGRAAAAASKTSLPTPTQELPEIRATQKSESRSGGRPHLLPIRVGTGRGQAGREGQ